MHHCAREMDGLRIALSCKFANHGATWIAEAKRLGNLIKGLAHGVVDGGAQDHIISPGTHVYKHSIATRDQAGHKRRLQVGRLKQVGQQVAFQVMDGNKRQVSGHAEALGKRHAYNKRADKTRTCGNTNGSQVRRYQRVATKVRTRAGHGLFEETNDSLGMLARSNLGHDAAKASVEVNLRCDNVCADHAM